MRVSFESRYGTWGLFPSDNIEITFPRVIKDKLIFWDSFNPWPAAPVCFARSDPAKSTRFRCETFKWQKCVSRISILLPNNIKLTFIDLPILFFCTYFTLIALPSSSDSLVPLSRDSMIILNIVCDLEDLSFIPVARTKIDLKKILIVQVKNS